MLNRLISVGIPLDDAFLRGDSLYMIADQDQVRALQTLQVPIEIVIPDLGTWSAARSIPATQRDFPLGSLQGNYTYDEAWARYDSLHLQYPDIISAKVRVGTTIEGRKIWAFKVSDFPDTDEDEPEVLFTGLTHAREPLGMMNQFYYVQWLCENYNQDDVATFLVNQREMWFVPILNPDGYAWNEDFYFQYGSPGYHRKNRRDTGCGTGTQRGVDLNRNYDYDWGADDQGSSPNPCSPIYRGTAPFSEPETDSLRIFMEARNFQNVLHYHAYGNILIHPFGNGENPPQPDYSTYLATGAWMTAENGYPVGTGNELLNYGVNGDGIDWSYGVLGLLAFLPEVGSYSDYFWPSANRVLPLCQDQLFQNQVFSFVAGSDPAVIDFDLNHGVPGAGAIIALTLDIRNRGLLPTNGPVELSYSLAYNNVTGVNLPDTLARINAQDTAATVLQLFIPLAALPGQNAELTVTVRDSASFPRTETVVFPIGPPQVIPGDIVPDLVMTVTDVIRLADIVAVVVTPGTAEILLGDVNGDTILTTDDLTLLINMIME